LTRSFRSHYGPGVDSASDRNEYQEHFLGVKAAAGAWGWQPYHHPVPLSCNLGTLTSWNPVGHFSPVTGLLYHLLSLKSFFLKGAELAFYFILDTFNQFCFYINFVSPYCILCK
jgi:hypothetical protein